MTDLSKMFDHDIELHGIAERPSDATTEIILRALREALLWPDAHGSGYYREDPAGMTEIEGEYDLGFVAKLIRARLP